MKYSLIVLSEKEIESFRKSNSYQEYNGKIICLKCSEREEKLISELVENVLKENAKGTEANGKGESESTGKIETVIEITEIMQEFGIPANLRGYNYLRTAIEIVLERSTFPSVTKDLYPEVAKQYTTTTSRVERAIRHAIEVGWTRASQNVIEETFGYSISPEKGKATNSQMIAAMAETIRLRRKAK